MQTANQTSLISGFVTRWLSSTNHKDIGILYFIFGALSGAFFAICITSLAATLFTGTNSLFTLQSTIFGGLLLPPQIKTFRGDMRIRFTEHGDYREFKNAKEVLLNVFTVGMLLFVTGLVVWALYAASNLLHLFEFYKVVSEFLTNFLTVPAVELPTPVKPSPPPFTSEELNLKSAKQIWELFLDRVNTYAYAGQTKREQMEYFLKELSIHIEQQKETAQNSFHPNLLQRVLGSRPAKIVELQNLKQLLKSKKDFYHTANLLDKKEAVLQAAKNAKEAASLLAEKAATKALFEHYFGICTAGLLSTALFLTVTTGWLLSYFDHSDSNKIKK